MNTDEPREHSSKLRALRKQRGWSQETLAKRAGVDQERVSRMERLSPPTMILNAIRIARALNTTVEDLFDDAAPVKTVPLTARLDTPGYRTDRPTFEEIAAHAKAHPLAGDPDDDPGTLHGGAWWIVARAGLIDPCGMMVELIPREWFSAWFDEITQVEHTASKRRVEWVELSMHTKAERGDFSFFTGRFPGCEEFRFYALDRDGNIVQRAV